MADKEHLTQLTKDYYKKAWNLWRHENPTIRPNLSGAILPEELLQGANLSGANLSGANLSGANLFDADLSGADLMHASLNAADLSGADLSGADLFNADLRRAHLLRTDLSGAKMGWTIIGEVDLGMVRGLDTVVHNGPSTISIDTIYRSHGNIPEVFLQGAGVPEDMITYMKSLVGRALEFYSCFISYSSKDQEFAERLHADLQRNGVRCWFAPEDIQGGKKLHEQIDQAIRSYERLLLILSAHSMQSEWVKTEIAKARQREVREKRQVLFPMRLVSFEAIRDWECFDADTGKDSAREIREYFIPDFSYWKEDYDAYQKAFQRLLRDLKAEI
jgi:TIR domain/Pentapeptide repeats (8 copies)